MTGPYGYRAQQPEPAGFGYPAPQTRPSGATAVIAALSGLAAAGAAGFIPIYFFLELPSGFSIGDLPGLVLTALGLYLFAALLLLIGALSAFFRSVAGAVLLALGSLLVIAAILVEPQAFNGNYGMYFRAQFDFETFVAVVRVVMFAVVPFTLLFAIIPPTLKYLRWRPSAAQPFHRQNPYPPQGGW
ncbi:hypothetical protein [Amycolatopsis sp. NPDC051071]|uniref:hypothetical protein n=1 Tax=Amycolatopsis sp. NPDC051071 TaxID=3154637 RepID=UPI00342814A7